MLAYCRNNPVTRIDVCGFADEEAFDEDTGDVDATPDIEGGASLGSNGGYPTVGITPGATSTATNYSEGNVTSTPTNYSGGNTTSNGPTYPQNPYDFNPRGLEMREHVKPGTGSNGGIIKWYYPGDKNPIFEWDEDYKNGSHYHAMEVEWGGVHNGDHLWPNTPILEPWRSRFF